jgi:hypothetical protein
VPEGTRSKKREAAEKSERMTENLSKFDFDEPEDSQ